MSRTVDSGNDGEAAVTMALSAEQLAAILEGETLQPGATLGNRLIGGLRLLGCVGEAGVAGALALAPEPTLLTKVASVGLAAHAADMCATGGRQMWTGRDERTFTDRGASTVAEGLGASPAAARNIGGVTEFMVPLGGAALAGAVRVGAIQSGRLSLRRHEARPGASTGGHTIRLHVGKSEAALRQRIAETTSPSGRPRLISSFTSLPVAEAQVSRVLQVNKSAIEAWSRTARQGINRTFELETGRVLGNGVIRATGQYVPMTKLRIVLRKDTYQNMPHYILSAYPIV